MSIENNFNSVFHILQELDDQRYFFQPLNCVLTHADGSTDTIVLDHTFNAQQIDWFKHGSALNRMKAAMS